MATNPQELCKTLPKVARLSEATYTQHAMVVALHQVKPDPSRINPRTHPRRVA
jgi:hypothetical protein